MKVSFQRIRITGRANRERQKNHPFDPFVLPRSIGG